MDSPGIPNGIQGEWGTSMIANLANSNSDPTCRAIVELQECGKYMFWFYGSRFFGNHTSHSDFDFYTEKKDGIEEWLQQMGFAKRKPIEDDADYPKDTKGMVHAIYDLGKVQVMVVNRVEVMNTIVGHFVSMGAYFYSMDKTERMKLWDTLVAFAMKG